MKSFIIFRDRVTYAKQCLTRLKDAGLDPYVVDHASTWPAAMLWLDELEQQGTRVLRRGSNAYPWQLWAWDPFREIMWGDENPYLVTDPDVVPADSCPADWLSRLEDVLARSGHAKVGLGLRLDLVPEERRDEVTAAESGFWVDEWEPGVFSANVDTTLALYRPYTEYPLFSLGPSLRLGFPYVADHLGWYETEPLNAELEYYYSRADAGHSVQRVIYE